MSQEMHATPTESELIKMIYEKNSFHKKKRSGEEYDIKVYSYDDDKEGFGTCWLYDNESKVGEMIVTMTLNDFDDMTVYTLRSGFAEYGSIVLESDITSFGFPSVPVVTNLFQGTVHDDVGRPIEDFFLTTIVGQIVDFREYADAEYFQAVTGPLGDEVAFFVNGILVHNLGTLTVSDLSGINGLNTGVTGSNGVTNNAPGGVVDIKVSGEPMIEGELTRVFQGGYGSGLGADLNVFAPIDSRGPVILTADGNIIHKEIEKWDASLVHDRILHISDIEKILKKIFRVKLDERKKIKGLPAGRADVIVAGTSIFRAPCMKSAVDALRKAALSGATKYWG